MRIEIMALTLALTGCLFAPPRPSNDGDGGVPDGGGLDGGGDADPSTCTPSPAAMLDVVAAVPKPNSSLGTDVLVRAGTDHGTAHVYFYEAAVDPLRPCADEVVELSVPGISVARVLAVAPGNANQLVVLAETVDKASLVVFEIDLQDFTVGTAWIELASPLGTFGNQPPSPFVAYVVAEETRQLWIGGPGLTTIDVSAGFALAGSPLSATLPNFDDKLLFAVPIADLQFVAELVGQRETYRAEPASGGQVPIAEGVLRDPDNCTVGACEAQLVRPVFGGPARDDLYSHVALQPATGRVAIGTIGADSYVRVDSPRPAVDVALHDFNGGLPDIVTLNGTSNRSIYVFTDAGMTPVRINQPVPSSVDRILVGTFTPSSAPQILGLSVSPTAEGAAESCFVSMPGTFEPCTGR